MDQMCKDDWIVGYRLFITWAALDAGPFTFTSSVGGSTSGTLSNAPGDATYWVAFSNGEYRSVTVTGTGASWSGALSASNVTTAQLYTTALLDAILDRLKTHYNKPKALVIALLPMSFSGGTRTANNFSIVPRYLTTDAAYGPSPDGTSHGWWGPPLGQTTGTYSAAIYRPAVADRYAALGAALGAKYNADPSFEAIMDQEDSAVVAPANNYPPKDGTYSESGHITAMKSYLTAWLAALLDRLGRRTATRLGPTAALFGALALTAAAGMSATLTFVRRARREAAPHAFARSVRRLTYSPGCEEYPSFVSSSSVLVFDGDVDGLQQLFTFDLTTRAVRQLTFGAAANRAAVVSPDGRRAVYEHKLDGPREVRLMQLDGLGDERSLGPGTSVGASWLDDHRVVIAPGATPLELDVDVPGATWGPLYPDPEHHRVGLTAPFSDGTLAASWWAPPSAVAIGLLSPSGLTVLVDRMPYTDGALHVAPSDDAFYFVRRAGAANELMRMPRQGGTPEVVQGGVAPARGIAISRDGERLVFSTCASHAQLARVDAGSGATPLFRPLPWSDTAPTPVDVRRLLFTSDRSGHDQLYVTDVADAGEPRALSNLDVEQGSPSRDGRWIVYAAHDPGGLWIVPVDGSAPLRRLTDGAHDEGPTFSRDGATIYFTREDGAFAVSREGGSPSRIAPAPARELTPSPVDDRIFFLQRPQPDRSRIMVVDGKGAVAPLDVPIPPGNGWSLTMAPDGKTLAMVHDGYEVLEVPLDGRGPARVRTRLNHWISSLSYTFDGQAFWASIESLDGDLWVADGEFR